MVQYTSAFLLQLTAPTTSKPLSSFTHNDSSWYKTEKLPLQWGEGKTRIQTLFNMPADKNVADKYKKEP